MKANLITIFKGRPRLYLNLSSLFAVFFLAFYNRLVCPFINGLSVLELGKILIAVLIFQIVLREALFYFYSSPKKEISLSRHGYYLSVISWCSAGVLASIINQALYPDFLISSHLKVLSSYWVLGAGVLAQLEYIVLEKSERIHSVKFNQANNFLERITRRITEGYFIFTLCPTIVMLLVVFRYVFEGMIHRGIAFEVAYIGVFCVLIALLVAVKYGKSLKDDTKNIIEALERIEKGQINIPLDISRLDELGEMSFGINQMLCGLKQRELIKDAFGRFVSPTIAEGFIEEYIRQGKKLNLGGKRREVVILMCDIRNFTPLAESMSAENLTSLLNSYYTEMVGAIRSEGGIVDKFIGDAVMAVFGLVDSQENPALNAVLAANKMRERLKNYNIKCFDSEKSHLKIGIGIHIGEVVAGYIGCAERLEFTVIGSPVNIAARIEAQAKTPNPEILFSKEISQKVQSAIPVKYITTTNLKGITTPVELFSLDQIK